MILLVAGYLVAEYRLDKIKRANAKIREEWDEMKLVNEIQLSLDGGIKDLAEYLLSGEEIEKDLLPSKFDLAMEQAAQLEQLQVVREEEILEEELHREQELAWIKSFKKSFFGIESLCWVKSWRWKIPGLTREVPRSSMKSDSAPRS